MVAISWMSLDLAGARTPRRRVFTDQLTALAASSNKDPIGRASASARPSLAAAAAATPSAKSTKTSAYHNVLEPLCQSPLSRLTQPSAYDPPKGGVCNLSQEAR